MQTMVNLVRGLCNAFAHVSPSKRQELLVEIKSKGQTVVDAMFSLAQVRMSVIPWGTYVLDLHRGVHACTRRPGLRALRQAFLRILGVTKT